MLPPQFALSKAAEKKSTPDEVDIRGEKSPDRYIVFNGNLVFVDAVLLAQMKLSDTQPIETKNIRAAIARLKEFYKESGYTLAEIRTKKVGDVWYLFIDEGLLDSIIIIGSGSYKTFVIRNEIRLPNDVFNKPQLERELERIKKKHKIAHATYQVSPIDLSPNEGLDFIKMISDEKLPVTEIFNYKEKARHRLYIFLKTGEWATGLGYGITYRGPYGLLADIKLTSESLIFSGDRDMLYFNLAGDLREYVDQIGEYYIAFTLGEAGFKWFTPTIIGDWLRTHIHSFVSLSNWQRPDIPLEGYYQALAETSLHIDFEFSKKAMLSLGGGADYRYLFGFDEIPGREVNYPNISFGSSFAGTELNLLLDEPLLRNDINHSLNFRARRYFRSQNKFLNVTGVEYQKVFLFGFNDLFIRAAGNYVWEDPYFHDALPLTGMYLRTDFNGKFFVLKSAYQSAEFRLSLYRQMIKFGIFNDVSAFGYMNWQTHKERPVLADVFGPGLHIMLFDVFQLDLYVGFGVSSLGDFNTDFVASFKKVY
ncbi:MAG: hypothetical protein Kow0090_13400 [Myxococcota bacterium]